VAEKNARRRHLISLEGAFFQGLFGLEICWERGGSEGFKYVMKVRGENKDP